MFKWPGLPSPRASLHELADFIELSAWRDGHASTVSVANALGRTGENDYTNGVPEEDESDRIFEDAYSEIQIRSKACGSGEDYPFEIDARGYTFRLCVDELNRRHILYRYLLLATRLNMKSDRIHANLDGTRLFEKLCAAIARAYLGTRASSFVFGTAARDRTFRSKVDELCRRIGEGRGVKSRVSRSTRDGKLDVVAWKPFADSWPGKIVIFGQCKTGTDYRGMMAQLQPDAFCTNYLQEHPALLPVRAFFVAEALPRSGADALVEWSGISSQSGLLFDRCRIIDFCDGVDAKTLNDIKKWTEAAARGRL